MNKVTISIVLTLFLCCLKVFGQQYKVGDLYTAPDGSQGIVYYIHPDGSGGWVVALNDASTGCAWGATSIDVPGLVNQSENYTQQLLIDTAGYNNTLIIRNFQTNNYYAAKVVDFDNGWVLPSPAQISMLYAQLPRVSTAIQNAGGTDLAYARYWSSAENTADYAFSLDFGSNYSSGQFTRVSKSQNYRVRAVRSFSYPHVNNINDLTFDWNTGETSQGIRAAPTQTTAYQVVVATAGGCGDTVAHTVVVNGVAPQIFYDSVCQGGEYAAHGFVVTEGEISEPGTRAFTRTTTVQGCDITDTLYLFVRPPVGSVDSIIAYDSYTWIDGNTYTVSNNTATYTLQDATGCDSIVSLYLIINPSPVVSLTTTADTICVGDDLALWADVVITSTTPVLHVPPVAVGDVLCTDNSIVKPADYANSGKTAMGIVFYVDNTGEHGWAVHLQGQGSYAIWGGYGTDIQALPNLGYTPDAVLDMDGYTNTQIIRNAGDASTYPAAYAVDFSNGWYIPAIGQLRLLYAEMVTINASLQSVGGALFPMNTTYVYWSSTESSRNYVYGVINTGTVLVSAKNNSNRLRSIRTF